MTNTKLYYLSQTDFASQIKNGKYPLQQKQIYEALADLGKPTRGMDAVDHAVKKYSLLTRQAYDVLAAWYFSPKRRPDCVRLGEPTIVNEDLADKITRLTDEIELRQIELLEAQEAFDKEIVAERESENEQPETLVEGTASDELPPMDVAHDMNETDTQPEPETKKRKGRAA